jgi:hypothetical protein
LDTTASDRVTPVLLIAFVGGAACWLAIGPTRPVFEAAVDHAAPVRPVTA